MGGNCRAYADAVAESKSKAKAKGEVVEPAKKYHVGEESGGRIELYVEQDALGLKLARKLKEKFDIKVKYAPDKDSGGTVIVEPAKGKSFEREVANCVVFYADGYREASKES